MTTYYKAVRPDGGSFHDPSVVWRVGETVTHSDSGPMRHGDASTYLSVSVEPADCTGFEWPCRLFRVEPAVEVITPDPSFFPNKRAAKAWQVVEELDPTLAFGPQGQHVAALIERCETLTVDEIDKLDVAWAAARAAARYAAQAAAYLAARDAARVAAGDAARVASYAASYNASYATAYNAAFNAAYAAAGLVVRDLISTEDYDTLTLPWRKAIGRLHPDDPEVTA